LLSVVVLTYEWPEALDVALRALSEEEDQPFEVVVADDGSGPATACVVERWRSELSVPLLHVRHEDRGWRKCRIVNLAAVAARGDYLLFVDGDCLGRRGFLRATRRGMLPGWFLASKRLHLSPKLSDRVLCGETAPWRWSTSRWLALAPREVVSTPRETGRVGVLVPVRDRRRPWRPGLPDFAPPYDGYGFYFGVHREDFERVNGFDMRFTGWGGEDEDIAARLRRAGVRCGWPGTRATMLHLWHEPKRGTMPSNDHLVRETVAGDHVAALAGLRELEAGEGDRVSGRDQESANGVGSSTPRSSI
jgi:glycosyltransferase involved in cell wall biosynthesis